MPSGVGTLLYRSVQYGDLAEFNVLDTRQYRTAPPCGRGEQPRCAAALDPATTMTGAGTGALAARRPGRVDERGGT